MLLKKEKVARKAPGARLLSPLNVSQKNTFLPFIGLALNAIYLFCPPEDEN